MKTRSGYELARQAAVPGIEEAWPGIVVCSGPEGEAEQPQPADNRYWVQRAYVSNAGEDAPIELTAYPDGHRLHLHVLADNPREHPQHSHHLATGQYVMVRQMRDLSDAARYVIL